MTDTQKDIQTKTLKETIDLDVFEQRFMRRYKIKKVVNAIVSFLIVFCG